MQGILSHIGERKGNSEPTNIHDSYFGNFTQWINHYPSYSKYS